jgi:hypothetical protein
MDEAQPSMCSFHRRHPAVGMHVLVSLSKMSEPEARSKESERWQPSSQTMRQQLADGTDGEHRAEIEELGQMRVRYCCAEPPKEGHSVDYGDEVGIYLILA